MYVQKKIIKYLTLCKAEGSCSVLKQAGKEISAEERIFLRDSMTFF